MVTFEEAISHFNRDKVWYGWKDIHAERNYDNLDVIDKSVTKPSEEEVNKKILELEFIENRKLNYPQLGEQFDKLFHDINNGTLDNTGEFFTALKEVKDAYPKEDE
jgi:hypothetical protein